jgi:hypothetical protein
MLTKEAIVSKLNADKLDYYWQADTPAGQIFTALPDGIWLVCMATNDKVERIGDSWVAPE